ncbi:MFS transporter [Leptolyngbya sp. NIES-2104]|uniref:MFS transporter n=1 Tax=Leptolyngbya sp. NIES-2104 TaxID=1552121 RepID=UPI0006EC4F2D|nr:MFS transporter [Leptolyngbya sp. NIES-2104]GAP95243.1 MFS permease [Leptolyngbya sp. NIES-2104]
MNSAISLHQKTLWLITIACTISIGSLYYNQPLLALISTDLQISVSDVSAVPTLTQIGYAIGLLLFVPLGDRIDRRKLIVGLSGLNAIALILAALSPSLFGLLTASCAIGLTAVVPQLLIPFAAQLADAEQRGRIVGTVMSGLLVGIILGRVAGGLVGGSLGWRSMFWIAAALMITLGIVLLKQLPFTVPSAINISYFGLLRSLPLLLSEHAALRTRSIAGAVLFASYSGFWAVLPFLLERPPFEFHSEVAGLFGLVGMISATASPWLGRMTDRTSPRLTLKIAIGLFAIALLILCQFYTTLWGLILGAVLLDLGTQTGQISNKAKIYSLPIEFHNRLTTIYMVIFFTGGAIGSWLFAYGLRFTS